MKLIVSAHGMLAKEVVNSAGMVFGAIDDLDIVTFVPGENAETLKARYKELIDGYKEDEEILFLVDLFGGSPYNAAFETQPVLDNEISGKKALLRLAECYRTLAENDLCDPCSAGDLLSRASEYEQQAQVWELPEEL